MLKISDSILIVYATDEKGVEQLYVSLFSLLLNKQSTTTYHIVILEKCISDNSKNNINKIIALFKNVTISITNCIEYEKKYNIGNINMNEDHYIKLKWPSPSYYRLLIPILFFNYEKAIYLDIDTLVLRDLTSLWNEKNIEPIGASVEYAIASWIQWMNEDLRAKKEFDSKWIYKYFNDGTDNYDKYVNSGILLFNIKKWKEIDFNKFIENASKLQINDQDLINLFFKKNIHILDDEYNLQLHLWSDANFKKISKWYNISENERMNKFKNAYIVHYTIRAKPTWILNSTTFHVLKQIGSVKKFCDLMDNFEEHSLTYGYYFDTLMRYNISKLSEVYNYIKRVSPETNLVAKMYEKWFEYSFKLFELTGIIS